MSSQKNDIRDIVNKHMNSSIHIKHYNKLNQLTIINNFPWDMQRKINNDLFIPTYNNITLYYKNIDMDTKEKNKSSIGEETNKESLKRSKPGNSGEYKKKGGTKRSGSTVYFI